ncbi:MAG TPA: protein phosphatase 2C domain-containing protein, partial [Anaerolineae bacterium]|nr:protein phosphatase 2C domain-containing protein [Anaerolineae bacterium]
QGQAGMGTTVVCAVVRGAELYLAHVGDSRAYLLRDGTLHLLTQDHTLVNEQVRHGLLTPEEASDHPQRHILSRALGARPEVAVEIGSPIPLRSGDTVMLCSDGVSGYVDDPQIAYALHANRDDPQTAADTLIQLADAAGGHDNATAIVLWIEKVVPLPRSVEAALATVLAPGPAGEIEPLPEAAARGGRARGCRRPGTGLALLLGGLAGLAAGVALTLLALSLLPGLQAKLAPPGPAVMPEESSVPAAAVATETPSPTATPSPSATPSATVTLSPTATRTASPSATVTASPEGTPESPPHRPVGRAF